MQETALSRVSNSKGARQTILFAKNFLKHPTLLGSFIPSSTFLINQLLSRIDWRRASVVVEYGPGIGNITGEVLKRLRPDGVLVAIELNPDFVNFLQTEFDDPRLQVIEGSALEVGEVISRLCLPRVDYIISGIPYSTISHEVRCDILRESCRMLQPDGAMLVYQFTRTVLPYLQRNFRKIDTDFELLNILPAHIFHCQP